MFKPGIEDLGITIALKPHRSQEVGAIQGGNETNAVGSGPRDFAHHFGAPRSSAIRTVERGINATFIQVNQAFRLKALKLLLKLEASLLVALAVEDGFFFG